MPKAALQLYSIKEIAEQDFYHAIHIAKQVGYNGVEFAGFYGKEAIETKKYLIRVYTDISNKFNIPRLQVINKYKY